MVDRRGFLAASFAGASGVVLAACGSSEDDEVAIDTETGLESSSAAAADVALLNQALELEHGLVAAYEGAVESATGSRRRVLNGFLEQERQHADALAQAVEQLGATPVPPRSDETGRDRDEAGLLRAEERAIEVYLDLLPKFTSPDLRGLAVSIATVEAQHSSVLLEALGRDPVPRALVTGSSG